jgi:hypothetical protein
MTLDEIKSHPKYPFDDIEDDEVFLMLELFWAQWFRETLGPKAHDWLTSCAAERDGNPILYVSNENISRAFVLIHKRNEDNKPSYKVDPANGHFPIQPCLGDQLSPDGEKVGDILNFFCDCTPEAEAEATKFAKMFCVDCASIDDVEKAISDYEDAVGMPE